MPKTTISALVTYGSFDTHRMVVREWPSKDKFDTAFLEQLKSILDEDVTAFLPPALVFRAGETNVSEWAQTFGKGSHVSDIRLIEGESLAGLLLLRPEIEEGNEVLHIGYIFGRAFWGKGLATELLRGLVGSLEEHKFKGTLHGGVDPSNPASARVLQKVGFVELPPSLSRPTDVNWFSKSFP